MTKNLVPFWGCRFPHEVAPQKFCTLVLDRNHHNRWVDKCSSLSREDSSDLYKDGLLSCNPNILKKYYSLNIGGILSQNVRKVIIIRYFHLVTFFSPHLLFRIELFSTVEMLPGAAIWHEMFHHTETSSDILVFHYSNYDSYDTEND